MQFKKASAKVWISVLVVVVLLIVGLVVFNSNKGSSNSVNGSDTKVKLTDTKFAQSSYLISDPTLSSDAQNAISGFNLSRNVLANGDIDITLIALNPEYQDQHYLLKSGQSLYFIESYAGDDNPPNGENPSLMDDHAIVVDSDGYVLTPLPSR